MNIFAKAAGGVALCALLAGCGGSGGSGGGGGKTSVTRFATGPLYAACMASDRKARSRALCGCVQAAANTGLSSSDQRLAATFFNDPQRAQDIRQSDVARHESFWLRYKAFGSHAKSICG